MAGLLVIGFSFVVLLIFHCKMSCMRNSGGGANHNAQRGNRMGLHINLEYGQHSDTVRNQVRKSCPRPHLRSLTGRPVVLASDDRVRRESIGT